MFFANFVKNEKMNEKEKRFVEYWEKKRASGFYKFSLKTGLIYALFVFLSAKLLAMDFHFYKSDIGVIVLAVLIGVVILGPFLWWNRERKYKKIKSDGLLNRKTKKRKK